MSSGRVTIADVAAHAGVSTMTVSRVVNGSPLVSSTTRRRVEIALRDLGYIPNSAARSLVVNRLGILALLIPDISNPFFSPLVRGAEAAARAAGYTLVLGNSGEDPELERAFVRAACSLRVDGLLIGATGDGSCASLGVLNQHRVPFVLIDREVEGVQSDIVRGESRAPARRLTHHLIEHGYTRVAMISGPPSISTARYREQGYRDALQAQGMPVEPDLVQHATYTREGGHSAALALLARQSRPDAVVTANNFLAFGAMEAARELGMRVPHDVAIVTFDDVEIVPDKPFLTCAAQPAEEMGRAALERLTARLNGDDSPPREVVLNTELRIRRSCGCT